MNTYKFENRIFTNKIIDKKQLKNLMSDIFNKYGTTKCTYIADKLKILGFRYATQAGISLNIEDLRVPDTKKEYLKSSENYIESIEESFIRGDLTSVDRFQYVIDKWSSVSDKVKDEVVNYFVKSDPFNPIYMMAFSGARGNLSQVRQLIGMRGLMADPQGQLIGLPIKSNFREGLTVTEYIISSYGARKGIVDTALRTADSGYLTRRLVDVSQDIIIRSNDCQTKKGILVNIDSNITLEGRTSLEDIYSKDNILILRKNQQIDSKSLNLFRKYNIKKILIRSSITCQINHSVCQLCYGWNLATRKLIDLGEAVGILAAQSIGEPGTQLTMRTFHTGGTFMGILSEGLYVFTNGYIKVIGNKSFFRPNKFTEGEWNIINRKGISLQLKNLDGRLLSFKIPKNSSLLFKKNNSFVEKNQIISKPPIEESTSSEQVTKRILSDKQGLVCFDNLQVKENEDKNGNIIQSAQNNGFLWVCLGNVINVPVNSYIHVKEKDSISVQQCLINLPEKNTFEGFCIEAKQQSIDTMLLATYELDNGEITKTINNKYCISFNSLKVYNLSFTKQSFNESRQVIGEQIFKNVFESKSGRIKITKVSELQLKNKPFNEDNQKSQIHLVPEYYFENIALSKKVFVQAGDYISKGSELFTGTFAKESGIVDILENDEDTFDLILRPGILIQEILENKSILVKKNKKILSIKNELKTFANLLSCPSEYFYVEQLSFEENKESFLLSPVETFNVPENNKFIFKNEYQNFSFRNSFQFFEKPDFLVEDDEIIKDLNDYNILRNQLIFEFNLPKNFFSSKLIIKKNKLKNYSFYIYLYENFIPSIYILESTKINIRRQKLYHEKQYLYSSSKIFDNQIICLENSFVDLISSSKKLLSVSKKSNYQIYKTNKNNLDLLKFKKNVFFRRGEKVGENNYIQSAGKVISGMNFSNENLILQRSKPYLIAKNSFLKIKEGYLIRANDLIGFLTYEVAKTEDIIQGLPRVEEILEARPPKNKSIIAKIPGFISVIEKKIRDSNTYSDNITVIIQNKNGLKEKYLIPKQRKIVKTGMFVRVGERLTDGQIDMRELLTIQFEFYRKILNLSNYLSSVKSFRFLQMVLINEIQAVYKSQGVDISDKHIEIIVRQMTTKVRIEESGKTTLVPGELVDLEKVRRINAIANFHGYETASYIPTLLGITKASLSTDSFISAASFQETARVLTKAAIEGKKDWLKGLKENVIVGRLIPAGTGLKSNHYTEISSNGNNLATKLNVDVDTKDEILDNRIKNRE